MGCNAWNHSSNCSCGWGGGNGYGGNGGVRIFDGFVWRLDRRPTADSFVNPNAICPVCGARVYFYQSPFGGRVFFDHLGPPWPKHPCTDNGRAESSGFQRRFFASGVGSPDAEKKLHTPTFDGWRPLLIDAIEGGETFDRVKIRKSEKLPNAVLFVPAGSVGDAPSFWRWCPGDQSILEISCISVDQQDRLEARTVSVPNWLRNDEDLAKWLVDPNAPPPPEALNAIGFSLSFVWRVADSPRWFVGNPRIDFEAARRYFERSAEGGFWAATNNLAVMYRDALGVDRDPERAFQLFYRAAQSLEPISLRHLANCYRDGFGCDPDLEMYSFIEELIDVRKEEQTPAA